MFLIEKLVLKNIMAEGGGNENKPLDDKIDNDDFGWDDDWNDDQHDVNITQHFKPTTASTPYHGGEQHEMQTMQNEQSGLPPSYDEKPPLLSTSDIERRLAALREDPRTGIIDTSQMADASINPLSEEDRQKQIERVKRLIKGDYPNAKFDSLPIVFSKKRPMDIVALGPKGGETKVVLNDGSGLQKSFLNLTYVKKALGPAAPQIIDQQSAKLFARQKVLEEKNADYRNEQQNFKLLEGEVKDIGERIDKKNAKVAQLKEVEGNEEEVKREEQVINNLKKDFKAKQNDREKVRKKIVKIAKENKEELQAISEEEKKRNEIEENFYDTKTFDVLKEKEIYLQRLKEENQVIIQDEMAPSHDKKAAEERVAAINQEIARLQTQIAEREATMPLRERVREIFKKYGVTVTAIFLAAGVTIGAVVGAITNALKSMGNQLANGLKDVGAKAASALPGLIGAIVSFLFKTAGQAIGYLAEHTWLLILAAVVFIFEKYIKRR